MLKQNVLADTGISVSAIGLGTVKFGRNEQVQYPEKFALPDDAQILELLAVAQELGINLLDTAPAYGSSEERLGTLLKNQRAQWVLSTKVGENFIEGKSSFDFSPEGVQQSIERSLKRLHTDYLDIVLIHSNGEDTKIIEENAIFETLAELKQAGKIRSYGMSTKTVAGGLLALQHSDIVMVTHNPTYAAEKSVIDYAHANNKGVFIKKALASGHLQKIAGSDPVLAALKFIFSEAGVSSVILGTLKPEHLRYNVACASTVIHA
jgi:aryl-alcohol dehydrogenase-like predicted oxidoreductase